MSVVLLIKHRTAKANQTRQLFVLKMEKLVNWYMISGITYHAGLTHKQFNSFTQIAQELLLYKYINSIVLHRLHKKLLLYKYINYLLV